MKQQQEEALLTYLNNEEPLSTLDPEGLCSAIHFQSAQVSEEKGILYYNFEVELDPEGGKQTATFSYQPSVMKIMDKEENMHLEFVREFETYFVKWMKENYYK
jgi:hypothetical protein